MKDTKRKTLIKAARKAAKKDILEKLIPEIKKISATAGAVSAKLDKLIAKESAKLAKKITGKIQLDEAAITSSKTQRPAAPAVIKKAEKPTAEKAIEKKTAKKTAKAEVVTAS